MHGHSIVIHIAQRPMGGSISKSTRSAADFVVFSKLGDADLEELYKMAALDGKKRGFVELSKTLGMGENKYVFGLIHPGSDEVVKVKAVAPEADAAVDALADALADASL